MSRSLILGTCILAIAVPASGDEKTSDRLIRSLIDFASDTDRTAAEYARQSLVRIGSPALPQLKAAVDRKANSALQTVYDDIRFTAEREAVAIAICVRQSSAKNGRIEVNVQKKNQPFFLILCSPNPQKVDWRVTIDEPSRPYVQKILLLGHPRQAASAEGGVIIRAGMAEPGGNGSFVYAFDHSDRQFIPFCMQIEHVIGRRPIRLIGREEYIRLPFVITDEEEPKPPAKK